MTSLKSGRRTATVDPSWYKDAVIYELHVRACSDSDGDGIGDFRGLADKLDYFADLGVTTLWLLPFYPSPLKDDGYDIADYTAVHPSYGTLDDFKLFLDEAHRRGLRVVTELVLNHTSSEHPWFQRARRSPEGSPERDFYVWSPSPERYRDARIIFKDFETSNWSYDPLARAYYWHRFYAHQPDLNFDNPRVHDALLGAVDFWFALGVDGMRLDAVPYLYEREGTNCENLAETHAFLRQLRRHVDARYPGRMLLAEANQWPEDAVAYFGDGDESHMAFHFPLMPRMFMALHLEDRFPILDILEQTPPIPESCQWAVFLRNHDELTLEMVTDEDRDYMYRVYAIDPQARINLGIRRRLAPLLGERRRIELMTGLLMSFPGTPVLYYGDEIGMGDNIYLGDRNGVRTPMQWSGDRNAGFSRANPQKLYLPVIIDPEYHFEAVNTEAQQNNPKSLLWWNKRLIGLRKRYRALSRGTLEFLQPENRKVLAFVRRLGDEVVLVVANLSRFAQYAELSLAPFRGFVPMELFGFTPFPPIGDAPYTFTLGPHAFHWFSLRERRGQAAMTTSPSFLSALEVEETWIRVLEGPARRELEEVLVAHMPLRRWFRGKARGVKEARIVELVPMSMTGGDAVIMLVRVEYAENEPETYLMPLAFASGDRQRRLTTEQPQALVARLNVLAADGTTNEGVLYDALVDPAFGRALLAGLVGREQRQGRSGTLVFARGAAFPQDLSPADGLDPVLARGEQTNTSILYGSQLALKVLRKIDPGVNPELEIGHFLTSRLPFTHVAPLAGAIAYHARRAEPVTLAVAHGFVKNEGEAWGYTLDVLGRYYEWAAAQPVDLARSLPLPPGIVPGITTAEPPALAHDAFAPYLASARLLGERTAELHLALAADSDDPAFAPEPFTAHYQRSLYEALRTRKERAFQLLRGSLNRLTEPQRAIAQRVLDREKLAGETIRRLMRQRVTALRIRCHGDYHLGQVLHTGSDFVIVDFEGEPDRSLSERRFKRSALTDVAGMLRSFHYAASYALRRQPRREDVPPLAPWAEFWRAWVSAAFVGSYLTYAKGAPFMPKTADELVMLAEFYLLEKAFYEVGYELNNRPEWIDIPLAGLLQMLG